MKTGMVQIVLSLVIIGLLAYPLVVSRPAADNQEELREYASMLRSQELYQPALRAYEEYLRHTALPAARRATIHFTMGDICRENLHDYESAMAHYLKVRQLVPDGELRQDASRHIVSLLERMQRSKDAQRELDRVARAGTADEPAPANIVVARVGDRTIALQELSKAYAALPEAMRKEYEDAMGVQRFVREYVAQDLMYAAARRAGYEKDPEVRAGLAELEKSLMIRKYYAEQVQNSVMVTQADAKMYYDAHQERFKTEVKEPDGSRRTVIPPFDAVADQAVRLVRMEKESAAFAEVMDRVMSAEKVEIYEDQLPARL
ncbi:hypothetical protein JW905_03795 [bacterium]|nr:hypothetical protein [candidate division CSSED10-310 bacterium]